MSQDSTQDFEQTLSDLEALVEKMESGNMGLAESLAAFEEGVRLTRKCQDALQQAELRIQMLTDPDSDPAGVRDIDLPGDGSREQDPRE